MRPWTPPAVRVALVATFGSMAAACNGGSGSGSSTAGDSAAPRESAQVAATRTDARLSRQQLANQFVQAVCPNDESKRVMESLPLSDSVETIPEYHDCQRLIEDGKYGPLVGIFAHANVKTYYHWSKWRDGRVAATVVSLDPAAWSYSSLGIVGGTNCLLLKASGRSKWQAALIKAPGNTIGTGTTGNFGTCPDDLSWSVVSENTPLLTVRRQLGVDMVGDSIAPPVARWDWDASNELNYIGVRCDADTWCEIGPDNLVPSPKRTLRSLLFPKNAPNSDAWVIKGYYDEQFLANAAGDAPTSVFATIVPGFDARTLQDLDDKKGGPREVARLELRETGRTIGAEYDRYVQKFKTRGIGGPPRDRQTVTYLELRPNPSPTEKHPYLGRFGGKDLDADAVVVRKHKDHLHDGPPVVRWRWVAKDELTWSYCEPDGCCESTKTLLGAP